MRERIGSFLSNESSFGKFMTKFGIIVCANLMFVLFSLPMVTIGASYVALYHVMLKTLRGDGVLNPFKQLFKVFSRFLPIVDDSGDFILDPDGNKIMPGSPRGEGLL